MELIDLHEHSEPSAHRASTLWQQLADARPPSYFLSWGWIENWLACLPRDRLPQLASFDGTSACFIRDCREWLHVVPRRRIYVNATGDARLDDLWIEYNALVGRDLPLDELLDALPMRWDEVVIPGAHVDAFGGLESKYRVLRREVPSYFVQLALVRERGYPALLSNNTRNQLRRAQREAGPLEVELARDEAGAIDIYTELVALHTAHWHAKGQPGAFADPWIDRFHRRLVARRFRHGEIQLVRVRTTGGTLGCLYNFVWQGRVLQYQSGFASFSDPHQKPGYVCHAAAIEHAAARGLEVYDFLGGDMRYKKSLSTDHTQLAWVTVQRRRLRFAIEARVLDAWHARRASASARP